MKKQEFSKAIFNVMRVKVLLGLHPCCGVVRTMKFMGKEKLPIKAHKEELFVRLYDYWRMVAPQPGRLPGRQHINPADFKELLGRIALVKVFEGPPYQFKYRLWGSVMTEIIGHNCTGKFLEELFPSDKLELVQKAFEAIVETATPHYWEVAWGVEKRDYIGYKRLLLPLAADGYKVDMILGMIIETESSQKT